MKKISIRMKFEYDPNKTTKSDVFFKVLELITDNKDNFDISKILDIHYLEQMIEKNEDNEEEEQYINFKGTMVLRNEDVFNEFKITYIIKAKYSPEINEQSLYNNILVIEFSKGFKMTNI